MLSMAVSLSPPVSLTVTVHVTDVGADPESAKKKKLFCWFDKLTLSV